MSLILACFSQVHTQLCEEEKMRLCYALNHEKLSAESLQHLGQNSKFPSITSLQVFITQESKHSSSISNCLYYIKRVDEFRICREHKEDPHEPVRPLARKHEHSKTKDLQTTKLLESSCFSCYKCCLYQRKTEN